MKRSVMILILVGLLLVIPLTAQAGLTKYNGKQHYNCATSAIGVVVTGYGVGDALAGMVASGAFSGPVGPIVTFGVLSAVGLGLTIYEFTEACAPEPLYKEYWK